MSFLLRASLTIGVLTVLALERAPGRPALPIQAPRLPASASVALDAVPNLRAALSGLPAEMRERAGAMARAEVLARLGATATRPPAPAPAR